GRDSALLMLQRLAPDEARPFVLAEIMSPVPRASFEALRALPDAVLPELDGPLLARLTSLAGPPVTDASRLRVQAGLLARYATAAIFNDVLRLYQSTANAA